MLITAAVKVVQGSIAGQRWFTMSPVLKSDARLDRLHTTLSTGNLMTHTHTLLFVGCVPAGHRACLAHSQCIHLYTVQSADLAFGAHLAGSNSSRRKAMPYAPS
jgi:hypothetical protein